MINIDSLFNLFPHRDVSNTEEMAYIDFADKPVYKLGMYKKLILNHINFRKKVIQFFKQTNAELSVEEMQEAGEFVTYNRAWSYIKNFKIDDPDHVNAVNYYKDEYLDTALELGISFFQQHEEYEKCAFLLKIKNKSEELQSKVGAEKEE